MKTENAPIPTNEIETLIKQFNGGNVYGLELILNEMLARKELKRPVTHDQTAVDWYGLNDLSI